MKQFVLIAVIACAGCTAGNAQVAWEQKAKQEIQEANLKLLAARGREMRAAYEPIVAKFLDQLRDSINNNKSMTTLDKRRQLKLLGDGRWKFSDPTPSDTTLGAFNSVISPMDTSDPAASCHFRALFSEDGALLRAINLTERSDGNLPIYDIRN